MALTDVDAGRVVKLVVLAADVSTVKTLIKVNKDKDVVERQNTEESQQTVMPNPISLAKLYNMHIVRTLLLPFNVLL